MPRWSPQTLVVPSRAHPQADELPAARAAERHERRREPPSAFALAGAIAVVALGVGLRAWIVASPLGPPDADEAVVGLMARHVLDGEVSTFYWGQDYGSAHEPVLVALALGVGVPTRAAMELVPIGLTAAGALLVWRIGLRILDRRAAAIAGILTWTASAAFVWQSTKERGFYGSTLVAGLAVFLLSLRIVDRPTRRDALLLGVAAGSGWYASPQVVYLVAPTLAWLAFETVRRRRLDIVRLAALALGAATVAAAPWIVANIQSGWASLRVPSGLPETTLIDRLRLFFEEGVPRLIGVRLPLRGTWPLEDLTRPLYVVILVTLVAALVLLPPRSLPVRLGVMGYPLIFALFPTSWYANEPRYLYMLWPFIALAVAGGLARIRWSFVRYALVAGVVVSATAGTAALIDHGRGTPGLWDLAPGDIEPLVTELRASSVDRAFADYWISHRVTLATDEEIIAAPLQFIRYLPYERSAQEASSPAYVLFRGSCYERELRNHLEATGVPYREDAAGIFVIIDPEGRVAPEDALPDWASERGPRRGHVC